MSDSPRGRSVSRSHERERSPKAWNNPREGEARGRSSRSPDRRHRSHERRDTEPADLNVVYVAKLSRDTRESDIKEAFSRFGTIKNVAVKMSFAFITYDNPDSAKEAIANMNGATFVNGEKLVVEQSGT